MIFIFRVPGRLRTKLGSRKDGIIKRQFLSLLPNIIKLRSENDRYSRAAMQQDSEVEFGAWLRLEPYFGRLVNDDV
jgi:hypothetical protein